MPETTTRTRYLRATLTVLVPVTAFLVLAAVRVPVCHSRLLFGIPCPGCGLTRATDALVHLQLEDSLRFHPLAMPVLVYLLVEMTRAVMRQLGSAPRPMLEALVQTRVRLGLGIALVALFAVRLVGGLGGLPDPVDVRAGLLGRGVMWAGNVALSVLEMN